MRSFSILRTNVGLTSNVKVTVDSNYNLYLDSINSSPDLDLTRFKKFQFNKNNFYDELVPYFFKDFPSDLSFEIKYSNDNSNMSNNFSDQYDDIYQMGARSISNNKSYQEEYEFLAPLYVFKQNIPKYFGIFRIDGAGLGRLDKSNFRDDFLEKFKCVKIFDLTKKTNLGEWVDMNFTSNKSFPTHSLEVDFRILEFSKWIGIDYMSGGFTSKSRFMDDALEKENTLYDFEKSFFDGFKTNKIIYPQIINFNFLFDDNPATKTSLRKWSINRYCGFYFDDMDILDSITPFVTPVLRSGVTILPGNILHSEYGDPFKRGFSDDNDMWVEYLGNFYKVEKFEVVSKNSLGKNTSKGSSISIEGYSDRSSSKYRIISDIDMSGGELLLNKKQFRVDDLNRIVDLSGDPYQISDFGTSDINLIEIDGKFHNLVMGDDGYITIWTDYGFRIREEYTFEYYINYPDSNYLKSIDIKISNSNSPIKFNIYKVNFTEIRDFDTNVVDSQLSRYEYEKVSEINQTEEPKLYTTDLRIKSTPPPINDYIYNGEVRSIPTSSDYTANLETFRIVNKDLTELWRKNSVHCRWGYQNSLSKSDYPYLLNNNEIHGDFNGTSNTNNFIPDRTSRNLDYFYTFNSGSTEYRYHSLHLEKNHGDDQDSSFRFELDKYLNLYYPNLELSNNGSYSSTYSLDYFEEIFASDAEFLNGEIVRKSKKYSYFEAGDSSIPNTTLFRGLKFRMFEVESINTNQHSIEETNLSTSNLFQDYKFSILMSQNNQSVDGDQISDSVNWGYFIDNVFQNSGNVGMATSLTMTPSNVRVGDVVEIRQFYPYTHEGYQGFANIIYVGSLDLGAYGFEIDKPFISGTPRNSGFYRINYNWEIVRVWETDIEYTQGDLVLYDDTLYEVSNTNTIQNPNQNPQISADYTLYTNNSPFWNPGITYSFGQWVYRNDEYYIRNSETYSQSGDFWKASLTYSSGDHVIYRNKFFENTLGDNISKPILNSRNFDISSSNATWVENVKFNTIVSSSTHSSIWDLVEIWNQNEYYTPFDLVTYDGVLYKCIADSTGEDIPGQSYNWSREYSFIPDTNFIYGTQSNPFIKMSNNTYICSFNRDYILDSGITIYINKKWKNILINISINDSTTENIDNVPRDLLYNNLNSRLSAANFIRQVNDLDSKYDFSKSTSYVIIEEDGTFQKYKFGDNIEDLPYLIICEPPDQLEIKNDTIKYTPIYVDKNILKPYRFLVDGNIDTIEKINYYNDNPIGCEIKKSEDSKINSINYGKLSNNTKSINRHSGPYMPIFYTIDLFESSLAYGNPRYKFNDALTMFGIMRQRIISKVNRKENILKLKNDKSNKSMYPMLDEFGYTFTDFFIFKSTWDYEYHIECQKTNLSSIPIVQLTQVQFSQNNLSS